MLGLGWATRPAGAVHVGVDRGMFRLARVVAVPTTRRSRGRVLHCVSPTVEAVDEVPSPPKAHVDGRRQFSDLPDGRETVERLVTDAQLQQFRDSIKDNLFLAPLTKGGNLPFRRLCVDFGCKVTVSEMVFARFALRRNPVELARMKKHSSEQFFGVQIATNQISEGVNAGLLAYQNGADFLDLNCGCPIHETWKRGLGAKLLKKPAKLERLVRGIADGIPIPLTVKIRLGAGSSEAPAYALAEAVENAGAAAVIIHGRTKEQRYTKSANWNLMGDIVNERSIPVIGNGDILTHYEHADRLRNSNVFGSMVGRGALIKPWIFREVLDRREWSPSAEERIGVYLTLTSYFKDHFRSDELGKKRYMEFMPWHFGFFCRYRALPESVFGELSLEHPLLQTRLDKITNEAIVRGALAAPSRLDRLLQLELEETHVALSLALWDAEGDVGRALELCDAMSKDGSLERWEEEERKLRSESRDPDAGIGDEMRG